jgi:hypothetical protein
MMPDPADRRQSERIPVTADTKCQFIATVVEDLGAVRIKNVSREGIGLIVGKNVTIGSTLAIRIENKPKSFSKLMLVRVVQVTPQGGSFVVGGILETPLTYQELTSLVM